jgi:hypothetical protein
MHHIESGGESTVKNIYKWTEIDAAAEAPKEKTGVGANEKQKEVKERD